MLSFRPGVRIFISTEPTDMRKGFDGLSAIVEHEWDASPLSGDLFVFSNRRQTLLKLLYWDTDGYAIWYKRLERGTFRIPPPTAEGRIELTTAKLAMILEGIDIQNTRKRKRYRR
jgi:transposase